jgi:glucosylceramidase
VVITNKSTHEIMYTGTYWYPAHFGKFVRPGAVRVETTGNAKGVRVMTFQTPESAYVAQLLNSRTENADVNLEAKRKTLRLTLPARSITTATW